jgi:protein tyrosine phosphatase (PTP) superfamily phosphohydrolase (DUF442 family)
MKLTDVLGYVEFSDHIATCGQPSEDQFTDVARLGYTTVVNLGLMDPRYCLADEAGFVFDLGLEYYHLPVDFNMPTIEDFSKFVEIMDNLDGKRVLVHCAGNYRASCFMALYGCLRKNLDIVHAVMFIHSVWQPNEVWRRFMQEVNPLLVC